MLANSLSCLKLLELFPNALVASKWIRLQEQACSPEWQKVTPKWLLQNTWTNKDRNFSSGLGKTKEGSGSARQSRQTGHTETSKCGRLPVPEVELLYHDQGEMVEHPEAILVTSASSRKEMWHPACVPSLHDVEAGTCGRYVAPGSHSSAQIRIGRTTGMMCGQKLKELN